LLGLFGLKTISQSQWLDGLINNKITNFRQRRIGKKWLYFYDEILLLLKGD
jgi:hypothetical protein